MRARLTSFWASISFIGLIVATFFFVLSVVVVVVGLFVLVNDVFARLALDAADAAFMKLDKIVDEGIEPPEDAKGSGSA